LSTLEDQWDRLNTLQRRRILDFLNENTRYSMRQFRELPLWVKDKLRKRETHDPKVMQVGRRRVYVTGDPRGVRQFGLLNWIARGVKDTADNPYAVASSILRRVSRPGLRSLARRFGSGRRFDPRLLRIGAGNLAAAGKPHGYLGRHVLDLGDRHAHAIVDVPWESLKVNLRNLKAKFDPWTRSLHGTRARLLAIRNPAPTDGGDRAIIEAAIHVSRPAYNKLRQSGEFDILDDGVLARRGRKKKATNIFVMPP
jgi:hypothetical protein